MAAQPFLNDEEVLEFEVIEEPWNEYEFNDGSKMRARLIINRMSRKNKVSPISVSSQNIFTITTSRDKRGPPSPLRPEEISGQVPVEKTPVKIITSNERWNAYRVVRDDQTLKVKLLVAEVFRVVNRFDQFGEPAYIVQSGIVVGIPSKAGRLTP